MAIDKRKLLLSILIILNAITLTLCARMQAATAVMARQFELLTNSLEGPLDESVSIGRINIQPATDREKELIRYYQDIISKRWELHNKWAGQYRIRRNMSAGLLAVAGSFVLMSLIITILTRPREAGNGV